MLHCYASRAITVIQPRPTFVFIYALFSITIAGCPPAPLDICAPPSDLQVSEIICPESCKQLESAQQQISLDLLGSSRLTTTIFNDSHTDNLATATVAPRGIITINLDFCNTCCCNISITGMQLQLGDFTLGDKLVNNASIGRAKPTDTPINGYLTAQGSANYPSNGQEFWYRFDHRQKTYETKQIIAAPMTSEIEDATGTMVLKFFLCGQESHTQMRGNIEAKFTNRPPRPTFEAPNVAECNTDGAAIIRVDGRSTTDPDGNEDIAEVHWYVDENPARDDGELATEIRVPIGIHTITLLVQDTAQLHRSIDSKIAILPDTNHIYCPAD